MPWRKSISNSYNCTSQLVGVVAPLCKRCFSHFSSPVRKFQFSFDEAMSKRHVAFIKPEEPSFLKKLKREAGYKEGPTVDTKRENLGEIADEDLQDTAEEQPTVVVLKPGDLTAEEAAQEVERRKKEVEEAAADLNSRIFFKASKKGESSNRPEEKKKLTSASKKLQNKKLLSFNEAEEDDH